MEYSEIIYLYGETIGQDEVGNDISTLSHPKKCYAKKQSVRTNEFYMELVIKRLNYSGESLVEWNNALYEVIRTIDPKNKYDIVLVCSKKIGVNG